MTKANNNTAINISNPPISDFSEQPEPTRGDELRAAAAPGVPPLGGGPSRPGSPHPPKASWTVRQQKRCRAK